VQSLSILYFLPTCLVVSVVGGRLDNTFGRERDARCMPRRVGGAIFDALVISGALTRSGNATMGIIGGGEDIIVSNVYQLSLNILKMMRDLVAPLTYSLKSMPMLCKGHGKSLYLARNNIRHDYNKHACVHVLCK